MMAHSPPFVAATRSKMITLADRSRILANKYSKSTFFVDVFVAFCISSTIFWLASFASLWLQWRAVS